jgi:hypothetical protein
MDLKTVAGQVARAGGPILATLVGGPIGAIGAAALGAIADALGVEAAPEAVAEAIAADPRRAGEAIARLEEGRASEWLTLAKAQADLYAEITRSELGKGAFWNAWRPAGMWTILLLWIWALVPAPLLKLPIDMSSLAAFTTLYLTLYMGGHTAKEWFTAHYAGKR